MKLRCIFLLSPLAFLDHGVTHWFGDLSVVEISTRNIHSFSIKNENGHFKYPLALETDGNQLTVSGKQYNYLHLELIDCTWKESLETPSFEKGPRRLLWKRLEHSKWRL
ncbi:MAG TPA: hypothetical protein VJ877_00435 [Bacteroidales bacterium]|nr:hypothetical protein [Bacteroidales bacterium]